MASLEDDGVFATDGDMENFQVQSMAIALIGGTSGEDLNSVLDDHDPEFRPYADMPPERLVELLNQAFRAQDTRKWTMLAEFLRNHMSTEELRVDNLVNAVVLKAMEVCEGIPYPEATEPLVRAATRFAREATAVRWVKEGDPLPL